MATAKKLTPKDIEKRHKSVPEWQMNKAKTELTRSYNFASFIKGLSFVARIAVHSEVLGHHPDIELSVGRVKVKLTTDSVKGLTTLDFELAKRINNLKTD